jgi:RNA polymerase sigma-70 factor (ECF subfamily)
VKQDVIDTVLEWYHVYKNGLYGYVYSLLGNHSDTEDVLQEVFVSIVRLENKVFAIRHPKTYLYRAVRNEAMRILKKRNGNPFSLELMACEPGNPDPGERELITKDMATHMLEQLKPADREIVVMHIYDGMSFKEIASVTGRFLPSIATRYYRALKQMKSLYETEYEDYHT